MQINVRPRSPSSHRRAEPRQLAGTTTTTPRRDTLEIIHRWGRSSVSPFLAEPGNIVVRLAPDAVAGYRPIQRWAVLPCEAAAAPGVERDALDRLLLHVATTGRRPVFTAVADPEPYQARGMYATTIADDARIDLRSFTLAGKRMASIRHSMTSARKAGLRMVRYSTSLAAGVERASADWLTHKRGGELGFTLGTLDPRALERVECRVAVDVNDRVAGFVTWRGFDDGHARVLDMMRRADDAPNPTMDFLIGECLLEFQDAGVVVASLGAVPRSHGRLSERIYPTISLRRYKEKYNPEWMPLSLVTPSRRRLPGALRAVAGAYCPGGITRALHRNG